LREGREGKGREGKGGRIVVVSRQARVLQVARGVAERA